MREKANLTQTQLGELLPGCPNKVIISMIETGRVMPDRETMESMCEALSCTPFDLFAASDLDLTLSAERDEEEADTDQVGGDLKRKHAGKSSFRCWLDANEKTALVNACKLLGYRSTAEWFREAMRTLLESGLLVKLNDRKNDIVSLLSDSTDLTKQ